MKPFLGIDLTNDRKNTKVNGEELKIATPSVASSQSLERSTQRADETIKKSKLPNLLVGIQWLSGLTAITFAYSMVKAFINGENMSLAKAYRNAPWVFWVCIGCAILWAVLKVVSVRRKKEVLESDEGVSVTRNLKVNVEAVYSELSVPDYAKEVDVLMFYYKEKNGEVKVCEKGIQFFSHYNLPFRAYADASNLYLANMEGKWSFPLYSLKAIRMVKKRVRLDSWNKPEEYHKGRYKQYKLIADDNGCIHCKRHYVVEFNIDGEEWGIYIPSYELPVFEALTGLKATEDK